MEFKIIAFVDSDYTEDTVTRRSRTGFLVKLNSAPIYRLPKKQSVIETLSFGSELMAMKYCCEYICGLRYKLKMMGVFVNGPAYIFSDNKLVLSNESIPDSVLWKKSNSIAYHCIRESSAAGKWRTLYIGTNCRYAIQTFGRWRKEKEVN